MQIRDRSLDRHLRFRGEEEWSGIPADTRNGFEDVPQGEGWAIKIINSVNVTPRHGEENSQVATRC
jgi:hypothetical protein